MAEPKQYVGHHHSSSAGHSIRSPLKSKIIRSQKITTVTSPTEPPRRQDYSAHLADVDDNDEEEEEEDDEDGEEEDDDDDDDEEEEEEEEDDDDDDDDDDEDNEQVMSRAPPVTRSHTPGHLATKSHDRRGKPSELSIRHRSQSAASLSASQAPSLPASASSKVSLLSANTLYTNASATTPTPTSARSHLQLNTKTSTEADREGIAAAAARRTPGLRSTSAIASKPGAGPTVAPTPVSAPTSANVTSATSSVHKPSSTRTSRSGPRHSHHNQSNMHAHVPFPPLIDPRTAPDVPPAPSSGMYWSRAPVSGVRHTALRAHTTTMIGSNVFVFGGCDSRACFNQLYVLDADSFYWSTPHVVGDIPVPLRAMTCTAVGKKLVIFGGGDGPAYYNDVYVLDTVNFRWSRPRIVGDRVPSKRRAHTACLYKNGIYVFGGGDGVRALNDIWRLDVSDMSKMSWKLVSGPSDDNNNSGIAGGSKGKKDLRPKARGYHTANMVGSKLIIFGGSDGGECFNDVWVWDVDTALWRSVSIPQAHRRLSHTSTIVGSFLFVVGGHDGNEYSNDVLLLNLVTMTWDRRRVYGLPPSGRGYHGTVLHDSRLLVIGGFDGSEVFGEVWMLELAVHAYYSQISHFSIEV